MDLPDVAAVQHESRQLDLASSAAELHGGLCGWLSGGGADSADWLARILADTAQVAPAQGGALDQMRQATVAQLEDRDFAFELLLTEDGAPLPARTDALFDWCRAFLGGFGLLRSSARHCPKKAKKRCRIWPGSRRRPATTSIPPRKTTPPWPRSRNSCAWRCCCCMATA